VGTGGAIDILVNNAALLITPSPTEEVEQALIGSLPHVTGLEPDIAGNRSVLRVLGLMSGAA